MYIELYSHNCQDLFSQPKDGTNLSDVRKRQTRRSTDFAHEGRQAEAEHIMIMVSLMSENIGNEEDECPMH
jgi:hypothetical protein